MSFQANGVKTFFMLVQDFAEGMIPQGQKHLACDS